MTAVDEWGETMGTPFKNPVRKKRLYVAGPMRGIKDFNFPAFDEAATFLRNAGYEVCNPADRDREKHGDEVSKSETGDVKDVEHTGFNLREALAWDLAWIAANADGIAVLPGWQDSKGALAEVALAKALVLPVDPVDVWLAPPESPGLPPLEARLRARGEARTTSSTGGEKGVKPARYDLIPAVSLQLLAEHYGKGALKYEDRNWERGYEWNKSFQALQRHIWAFWNGEDVDPETGSPHVIAAAWHCFSLAQFQSDPSRYAQFDDRPTPVTLPALVEAL